MDQGQLHWIANFASPFTLRDLRGRAREQQLKADFEAYLDGFSPKSS